MATVDFGTIPGDATLSPVSFKAQIGEDKLQQMKELLKLSPIGPAVWENASHEQGDTLLSNPSRRHGTRRDWLANAKDYWLNHFDWRKSEERINSFPNFQVDITGTDGVAFKIHFVALFSKKAHAIPIAFYHGWPGSFLEFLKVLDILRNRYTPETLPYHVIVPSLPGYTYSSGPPADVDYSLIDAAELLHRLMLGLGFDAYLSQGGDLGSKIARRQAATHVECKSMHLNMTSLPSTSDRSIGQESLTSLEVKAIARGAEFEETGRGYGIEHGTRTATIGLALSTSPLALLAWIGEKFLEWSDTDLELDEILESVTLYWLTDTFPRCIYPYRDKTPPLKVDKPFAFSFFPKEIIPTPKSWVEQTGNLKYYYSHDKGGHFAAIEQPEAFLKDVEDWAGKVWQETS